jgi:hypothetical protein
MTIQIQNTDNLWFDVIIIKTTLKTTRKTKFVWFNCFSTIFIIIQYWINHHILVNLISAIEFHKKKSVRRKEATSDEIYGK